MVAKMVRVLALPYPELLLVGHRCCNHQEAGSALLLLCSQGLLGHTHISSSSSTVLSNQGVGPTLPSAAVYEGLGQLSCLTRSGVAHWNEPSPPGPAPLCCIGKVQGLLSWLVSFLSLPSSFLPSLPFLKQSYTVSQSGLEFETILPWRHRCRDYVHELPCLVQSPT